MALRQSRASGSAILDTVPPSPEDKIYEKPTMPGDDTRSLLGDDQVNPEGGAGEAASTPGGKLIIAVTAAMQAISIAESITPGFWSEQFKMEVAANMERAPLMAEQLARQQDPMALLSAIGGSAAAPPMGVMPAMGMAQPPMAGGSPPMGGRPPMQNQRP